MADLPKCGTCPYTVPSQGDDLVWCHGGPPSAREMTPGTVQSVYPLLARDAKACALHPDWPWTWRWWR